MIQILHVIDDSYCLTSDISKVLCNQSHNTIFTIILVSWRNKIIHVCDYYYHGSEVRIILQMKTQYRRRNANFVRDEG